MSSQPNPQSQEQLMQLLQFSTDDLQANRAGKLSQRQHQYLTLDRQKNIILGAVLIVGLIFGITTMLFVGLRDDNIVLQVLAFLLLICNALLSWFFGMGWVRMTYDLRSQQVNVVEGAAQHVVRQLGRAQAGSVRIGDTVEIPADVDLFKAFAPGTMYRLYRTSHSHRLLSVEYMENGTE